ncbi:hypothetical protein SAMN05216566_11278 [Aureimonas phyllosphaerae]|nr:hypothetical protein SAMN05216566_11278 [Aureimonas phyllosphaerae]
MRRLVAFFLAASTVVASAASLRPEVEKKTGDWSAVLYRNESSNRLFCALESHDGDTVFRIVRYKDQNDTFLEVHNASWELLEGRSKFSIEFDIKGESYAAELMGMRDPNSYYHDFTGAQTYAALLGMIAQATTVTVLNPNGTKIASFRGRQSDVALNNFGDCLQTDWTAGTSSQSGSAEVPYRFAGFQAQVPKATSTKFPDFQRREKDFSSFRTRIREGMKAGPNLAGHYSVTVIGCGTACVFAVVGDNKTGRLVRFPRGGEDNMYLGIHHRIDSSLVVAQWVDPSDGNKCKREYFNFTGDKFDLLDTLEVGSENVCLDELPLH